MVALMDHAHDLISKYLNNSYSCVEKKSKLISRENVFHSAHIR